MQRPARVRRTLQTLIIPAMLSALGFFVTIRWHARFDALEARRSAGQGTPIATLAEGDRGVEKRPKARLIWQEIPEGTSLYRGDAVRTAPGAEGRVRLADGTVIAMEPDSLIILEDTKAGLELNLVSGSLFVAESKAKKDGSASTAPVIKAGATKLVLGKGGTELSLSKKEGAEATVAVAKGDVAVKAGTQEFTVKEGAAGTVGAKGLDDSGVIDATFPKPNAVITVKGGGQAKTAFRWQPLAKDYVVELALGASRESLRVATAPVAGDSGSLSFAVPSGTFYWQLKARHKTEPARAKASVVLKAESVFLHPPEPLLPTAGTTLVMKDDVEVTLAWKRSAKAVESRLQLATDPGFGKVALDKALPTESDFTVRLKREGRYHWRVVDRWDDLPEPLRSKTMSFDVKAVRELAAPQLVRPGAEASVTRLADTAVFLEWTEVPAATGYKVQVTGGGKIAVSKETVDNQLRLPDLAAGGYEWKVMAVDDEGTQSPWSQPRRLTVTKMQKLAWLADQNQIYRSKDPEAILAWKGGPADAASYRVRYAKSEEALDGAGWRKAAGTQAKLAMPGDGVFYFEVQAVDGRGAAVAVSEALRLSLAPEQELEAPEILASGTLQADASGALAFQWRPVEGAAGYVIEVRSAEADGSRSYKAKSTDYRLVNLMPGKYTVRLATVNSRAVQGKFGPAKTMIVPAVSDLPPPSIQNLKVH